VDAPGQPRNVVISFPCLTSDFLWPLHPPQTRHSLGGAKESTPERLAM